VRSGRKANDPKLADVIDRYVAESEKQIGRTKAQVLRKIKTYDIADLQCSEITSAEVVAFAQALSTELPQPSGGNLRRSKADVGLSARPTSYQRCVCCCQTHGYYK
jgi:hypothetical protein